MSDRMVASLRDAGVDNLDTYRAVLRNTVTGKTYPYQAVNIIGLVRGVDMAKSTWESYDGDGLFDTHFQGVAVDEDATKRLLLFRLAEHTGTIVVHESVRNRLGAAGFPSLVFLPPGEWTT